MGRPLAEDESGEEMGGAINGSRDLEKAPHQIRLLPGTVGVVVGDMAGLQASGVAGDGWLGPEDATGVRESQCGIQQIVESPFLSRRSPAFWRVE